MRALGGFESAEISTSGTQKHAGSNIDDSSATSYLDVEIVVD